MGWNICGHEIFIRKSLRVKRNFLSERKFEKFCFETLIFGGSIKNADTLVIQNSPNTTLEKIYGANPPRIIIIGYQFICANETPRYYAM